MPDEVVVFASLAGAPDGSGAKLAALICGHCGSLEQAERDFQPIRAFGTPALDALGPIPYAALNTILDAGFPRGARNYWKSGLLPELSDQAIETMVGAFARCPSPMGGVLIEHLHGEATRVPPEATAYPNRQPGYNFLAAGQWRAQADDAANIAWTRDVFAAMQPCLGSGGYLNYFDADETSERVARAFGINHARLREVKRKYDPANLFHMNQNILPA